MLNENVMCVINVWRVTFLLLDIIGCGVTISWCWLVDDNVLLCNCHKRSVVDEIACVLFSSGVGDDFGKSALFI